MDFELPELLTNLQINGVSETGAHMRGLLNYLEYYTQSDIKITETDFVVRLIWLISHYISSASCSHGSEIGYLHNNNSLSSIISKLDTLADVLPPTVTLKLFQKGEVLPQMNSCGKWTSDFEKNDMTMYQHDKDLHSRRLGVVLIHYDGVDDRYLTWVEEILESQPLLSHVLILTDNETQAPIPASIGKWIATEVPGLVAGLDLTVLANPQWEADLAAAPRLDTSPAQASATAERPELVLPVVSGSEFPDLSWVTITPEETLAGPEITIYDLNSDGGLSLRYGRLSPIKMFERKLCECRDVCISHIGVVWRNDRVLQESFAASPHDAPLYNNLVAVSKPTLHLEGTYFLVPTAWFSHSHLILETLTKLDTIESYRPQIKLLCSTVMTPSQRQYFPIFGFSLEDCIFKEPSATYRVEKLIMSVAPSYPYRHSTKYLQKFAAPHYIHNTTPSELIYLTRKDTKICRNMINEDEIEQIFVSFGFKSIVISELSVEQKISLFSSARCVAGPLGAAFLYMSFVTELEQIILTSDLYFPAQFIYNAAIQMSSIHYIKGVGLKYYNNVWKYEHSSFYIPPDLVTLSLKTILPRFKIAI